MNTVISKDGTIIAYEKIGSGKPLILVDGALCYRSFGPMPKLAKLLAEHFTVYYYDRRGRGNSTDVQTYSPQKEVDDIAALVKEVGGSAYLAGLSSGAVLALLAAESGLSVPKIALYEPPFVYERGSEKSKINHGANLSSMLAHDKRGTMVKYFMVDMVGAPAFVGFIMQLMPMFKKLKAVAHTLPYDAAVMGDFTVPTERIAKINNRTLIAGGRKSPATLHNAVQSVADALPNKELRWLEGQTHNVKAEVLAPVLTEFFNN
ncbi:MAG: alpha/beta hydrolase [Ignavibacteriales bacterium]|nr:alpha/beta hydrolase [Ignavibacteriales bacterium]